MDQKEYLKESRRTMQPGTESDLLFWVVGLTGEAGEVGNRVKKAVYHDKPMTGADMADEVGDLLWYAAGLIRYFGLDFNAVFEANIAKLRKRYPDSYTHEDAKAQKDYGHGVPED